MDNRETLIALRRIMRAIDLHSKRLERSAGLTVPQLLVLQAVESLSRPTVGEVATEVHLSQGTVTAIISRLVDKRLLQRERHAVDGRKVCVTLTGDGMKKLADAPGMLQEDFVQRLSKLPSWEQKSLASALERVAVLMDAQEVDASPILEVGDILAPEQKPK